jgi:glycosyltransferase involved in cell wall biosynthesis
VREWHGLDAAIDVVAAAQPFLGLHLLVAGDGPARESLERQARDLGVSDRVTFAGIVPRDEIPSFVAAFDIALQPRAVRYASPLKIFEYMAAGRAIIAPDLPNIREILWDDETALLIDPDSPLALSCAVERLARDMSLRQRLGTAARWDLLQRGLTWDGNARRVTGLLETLHDGACSPAMAPPTG